jgi:hypothetical protein
MDVSPFALSRLLSDLTGRKVQVVEAGTKPASAQPATVGVFIVHPSGSTIVMKTDTLLLGALGGALAGLPEAIVKQQVAGTLDETLRDAMHEVLNVTSSVLTTKGRAVLQQMVTEKPQADALTRDASERAHLRVRYNASLPGCPSGDIVIYAVA